MRSVQLRPARSEDEEFLFQVYASTRADEMALVTWDEKQKDAFLRMQFNAQAHHYRIEYPNAEWKIILRDQTPIGRLIVNRGADTILLMDITLLPEHRNLGFGTALVRDLMNEASATNKPLRLHVEIFNPAQHLYDRLDFQKISEVGIYVEMEWLRSSAVVSENHDTAFESSHGDHNEVI